MVFSGRDERAGRFESACEPGAKVLAVRYAAAMDPPDLKSALAEAEAAYREVYGLHEGIALAVFGDAREALECVCSAFLKGKEIVLPKLSDGMHRELAEKYGAGCVEAEMSGARVDAPFCEFFAGDRPMLLSNPLCESGEELKGGAMRTLARSRGGELLVVDEAYADYGLTRVYELMGEFDNILTVRQMSCGYSMCGCELAFAAGAPRVIEALEAERAALGLGLPHAVDAAVAAAALGESGHFIEERRRVSRHNIEFLNEMRRLGLAASGLSAPFVMVKPANPSDRDAESIAAELRRGGMYAEVAEGADGEDYVRLVLHSAAQREAAAEAFGVSAWAEASFNIVGPAALARQTGSFVATPPDPPLVPPETPLSRKKDFAQMPVRPEEIPSRRERGQRVFLVHSGGGRDPFLMVLSENEDGSESGSGESGDEERL